jgi:hypothetical protein
MALVARGELLRQDAQLRIGGLVGGGLCGIGRGVGRSRCR